MTVFAVKQGLQELYNFKKQNPDANLAPFLDKSSQYFRDYIERGLKNIESELGGGGGGSAMSNGGKFGFGGGLGGGAPPSSSVLADAASGNTQQEIPPHQQYLERLKRLREQGGLGGGGGSANAASSTSGVSSASSAYRQETKCGQAILHFPNCVLSSVTRLQDFGDIVLVAV